MRFTLSSPDVKNSKKSIQLQYGNMVCLIVKNKEATGSRLHLVLFPTQKSKKNTSVAISFEQIDPKAIATLVSDGGENTEHIILELSSLL